MPCHSGINGNMHRFLVSDFPHHNNIRVLTQQSAQASRKGQPDFRAHLDLPVLLENYEKVGERSGARTFLAEMCEHYRGIAPVLALARMVETEEGVGAARRYLAEQLKDRPSVRGEAALIDLSLADKADA